MYSIMLINIFETIISVFVLIIFLPVFVIIILLQIIFLGFPIFYIDVRLGKDNKPFKLIKFRTMSQNYALSESLRINTYGKLLRKSSLDELPQLINVLKRDMSFVGPRPINQDIYDSLYINFKKDLLKRQSIRPGMTGYCQILYRGNKRFWKEKINLDIYFVNNFSTKLYFKILLITIPFVFKKFFYNKSGASL